MNRVIDRANRFHSNESGGEKFTEQDMYGDSRMLFLSQFLVSDVAVCCLLAAVTSEHCSMFLTSVILW